MFSLSLSPAEFQRLSDFIYLKTGIRFDSRKEYYVTKRVEKRMQALGIGNFSQYLSVLRYGPGQNEMELLINSLTVNETYFFREYGQLKCFAEEVIPLLVETNNGGKLKIWSAGCSSGEEAYTLAIILLEMLAGSGIQFEVHGTDINTSVLIKARSGCYDWRSVREVPRDYLARYFVANGDSYQILPEVKEHVRFYPLNLKDISSAEAMRGFNAIFCRNVLIYFDEQSRREAVLNFYQSLLPGGYVFLGHAESMSRITSLFKPRRFREAIIYQK